MCVEQTNIMCVCASTYTGHCKLKRSIRRLTFFFGDCLWQASAIVTPGSQALYPKQVLENNASSKRNAENLRTQHLPTATHAVLCKARHDHIENPAVQKKTHSSRDKRNFARAATMYNQPGHRHESCHPWDTNSKWHFQDNAHEGHDVSKIRCLFIRKLWSCLRAVSVHENIWAHPSTQLRYTYF